jgi:dodecin
VRYHGRGPGSAADLHPSGLAAAQANSPRRSHDMSVAKIIEISSASKKSFEDAIVNGIARANESLDEVQGAWVKSQKVEVVKGKIVEYRVTMKVTFLLKNKKK